ncbi:unnamed protein product [Sphagnum jensenii]|uniref:Uncharacterized protein n=1 Tax=Sphagnum jensenii TaxID=128206 RepID=A0ABP0VGA3_9BRYO
MTAVTSTNPTAEKVSETLHDQIGTLSISQFDTPKGMVMGGYREYHGYWLGSSYGKHVLEDQARYIGDKKELDATLAACTVQAAVCNPNIKAFSTMVEKVKTIEDEITQSEVIQAWVDAAIVYDHDEEKALDKAGSAPLPYRTLTQSLIDLKGVCKEIAELKFVAHELIGRSEKNMRLVAVHIFDNGVPNENHAVIETRIGHQNFILNLFDPMMFQNRLTPNDLKNAIISASTLETDATTLNVMGTSKWSDPGDRLQPYWTFNSVDATYFGKDARRSQLDQSPPVEAYMPQGKVYNLGIALDDPRASQKILEILKPAFALHYELVSDPAYKQAKANVPSHKSARTKHPTPGQ